MKKLLCLLLSVLLVLSFAACDSGDDDDDDRRSSRKSKKGETVSSESSNYEDAIKLVMKGFEGTITEKEVKKLFPDAIWECYAEEEDKSIDELCQELHEERTSGRADLEEYYGEDMRIEYEIVSKADADEDDFDQFKQTMEEEYGLDPDTIGKCYEVEIVATMVGKNEEEENEITYHVVEIDGAWYIAELLAAGV